MAGRHRAPTPPSNIKRNTVSVVSLGAMSVAPIPFIATQVSAEPPGGWGPIIECESGGDPRIENQTDPNSTASGLFQFTDPTWRSVGGTGRAKDASVEEQYMRANLLYERRGTQPWDASKSCWSGRTPSSTTPTTPTTSTTNQTVNTNSSTDRGTYVCDRAHLYFEACDPHNLGETVSYPSPRGSTSVSASGTTESSSKGSVYTVKKGDTLQKIAERLGVSWRDLYNANKDKISDPNLIFPDQRLVIS